MGNLSDQLVDYFNNTPKEQLDKDWEKLKHWNEIGPDVDEWVENAMEEYKKRNIEKIKIMENYKLVDLGLSSGTLWMDRNVGASSPEDAGLYFAWGETTGYTADEVGKNRLFNWNNYTFDRNLAKYNSTDGLTTLEITDDAAYQYTEGKCKIPSKVQIIELIRETTSVWVERNGVNGRLFTSKTNGNSIFIPATGCARNGVIRHLNRDGELSCSTLYEKHDNCAMDLFFCSGGVTLYGKFPACYGVTVRGITDGKNWIKRREKLLQEPLFKPLIHTVIDNEKSSQI